MTSLAVLAQEGGSKEKLLIRGRVIQSPDLPVSVDTVIILDYMGSQFSPNIKTAVVNDEFQFWVPRDLTGRAMLRFMYRKQRSDGRLRWIYRDQSFMIEDTVMDILIDKKSMQVNVTGGRQNQALNIYNSERNKLEDKYRMRALQRAYSKSLKKGKADTAIYSAYRRAYASVQAETGKLDLQFISDHPYSWQALYLLDQSVQVYLLHQWKNDPDGSELKEYSSRFFGLEKPVQEKGDYLLELLKNETARRVPTFTGEMPDGKLFDLANLKGKVVLIDFWGSWCAACRKGHPHLKDLYAKYKDRGFEIVGVGTETGSREEQWQYFKKAIAYDGITWPQVLNNPAERDLFALYGIKSCPTKLLVDRDGRLLLRITEDTERLIDKKLEELFEGDLAK